MVDAQEVFTVYAYDLNTNTKLCELPANSLTFDSRLNDAGSISFNIALQSPGTAAIVAPILSYGGNPFAVYVDRSGVIVWGGIAWTGLYTRSTGQLAVGGKEFLAYFDQRIAAADYSVINYPSGIDPAQLLYKVFTDAQNTTLCGPGASIGLNVVSSTSGIPPFVPGYPLSQRTTVSSIIRDVTSINAPGAGGVELQIICAYDINGLPQRTLTVKTPRAGRVAGSTGLMFDLSNCLDFTWPTDASQAGNTLIFTGAGNGAAIPVSTVQAPGVPVGGLGQSPRLDKVIATSAQSQAQIDQMAHGTAQQYGTPLTTPKVTVLTSGAQPLGSWIMGDDVRLYMPPGDDRFPFGLDQFWRIVQHNVTVADAGVNKVDLTLNIPPSY
jgi:hypothetical protein